MALTGRATFNMSWVDEISWNLSGSLSVFFQFAASDLSCFVGAVGNEPGSRRESCSGAVLPARCPPPQLRHYYSSCEPPNFMLMSCNHCSLRSPFIQQHGPGASPPDATPAAGVEANTASRKQELATGTGSGQWWPGPLSLLLRFGRVSWL